jgi:hypothetical protein
MRSSSPRYRRLSALIPLDPGDSPRTLRQIRNATKGCSEIQKDETGARVKVFLAGASGAIGRRIIPQLVRRDHHVIAATRTTSKMDGLRTAGAEPAYVTFDDPHLVAGIRETSFTIKPKELRRLRTG